MGKAKLLGLCWDEMGWDDLIPLFLHYIAG